VYYGFGHASLIYGGFVLGLTGRFQVMTKLMPKKGIIYQIKSIQK